MSRLLFLVKIPGSRLVPYGTALVERVIGLLVSGLFGLMPLAHAAPANLSSSTIQPASAARSVNTVVVLGDSLSAAYGLRLQEGWVHLLEQQIQREGYDVRLVNASVSGETSVGGAERLKSIIAHEQPSVVVIELGANDALRGLSLEDLKTHLTRMVQLAQSHSSRVLLIGIVLPDNYGPEYRQQLAKVYASVAKTTHVPFVANLLSKVTISEQNFQPDHLHPTAAVQPLLTQVVWQSLKPLLIKPHQP